MKEATSSMQVAILVLLILDCHDTPQPCALAPLSLVLRAGTQETLQWLCGRKNVKLPL